MFEKDRIKAEFILEMIDRIERIVERHGGVSLALKDFEGEMAILLGIAQIGETLAKLSDPFLERAGLLDEKRGAYLTRNYIVHDYEGVDRALVEQIVRTALPKMKSALKKVV